MKQRLYVVRDRVLGQSWNIAEAKNDAVALRNFEKMLEKQDFKDDFELYCVGTFDHDTDVGELFSAVRVTVGLDTPVEDV